MLDSLLSTALRGAEKVQRRAEEVAQIGRLRLEIFQLTREMDALYTRIGRAYHAGAERETLQDLCHQAEQRAEDIKARERLIEQLGSDPEVKAAGEQQAVTLIKKEQREE